MVVRIRTRFEVFKRDDFTCRYCGRRSPEVILEIDHIVPSCDGGSDDPINLVTSCWDCNRGKGAVALNEVMTGEDPHDRAIEILERKRQLEEYDAILKQEYFEREQRAWDLWRIWQQARGRTAPDDLQNAPRVEINWLLQILTYCPRTKILEFMDLAITKGFDQDLRYVGGCIRRWREDQQPNASASTAAREDEESGADARDTYMAIEASVRASTIEEVFDVFNTAVIDRRHLGYCWHQPPCEEFVFCVLRATRDRLTPTKN